MNRQSIILLLILLAAGSIGYAIYRSTTATITQMENGRQVVYGQPMHGLMLGLCFFAGTCLIAIILLLDKPDSKTDERIALSKRTLS